MVCCVCFYCINFYVVCSSLSSYVLGRVDVWFHMSDHNILTTTFSINVQETSQDTFIFYLSSRGLLLLALSNDVTRVMIDYLENCGES